MHTKLDELRQRHAEVRQRHAALGVGVDASEDRAALDEERFSAAATALATLASSSGFDGDRHIPTRLVELLLTALMIGSAASAEDVVAELRAAAGTDVVEINVRNATRRPDSSAAWDRALRQANTHVN